MEPTDRNRRLLETAQRLGRELDLTLDGAGLVGGGSDANTTSRYTATLDGLGPVGDGAHAADEHVSIPSIAERAALLALLLLEPAGRQRPKQFGPGAERLHGQSGGAHQPLQGFAHRFLVIHDGNKRR